VTLGPFAARAGWRGIVAIALAGAALLAAISFGVASCGGGEHRAAASRAVVPKTVARPGTARDRAARPQAPRQAPGVTTVATLLASAPRYAHPGVREPGSVPSSWWYRQSVLPVLAARPGWVQVRLAQRPNGSTAWLPAGDVTLGTTPYRIVVDLATTRLRLYEYGRLVLSVPAGVGTVGDPTPTGAYFVAFDEQPPQPNPGYGPFIMVTSAHSPSIADWAGSGDAIIGIHGPLGADTEIGATGARISNGCIRLHLKAQERLAEVPPGTPIDVIR